MQEFERTLRDTFTHAQPTTDVSRAALRESACAYTDRAKELGWPIERVIVEIKRIARESGLIGSDRLFRTDAPPANDLLDYIVRSCIQRYYSFSPRAD